MHFMTFAMIILVAMTATLFSGEMSLAAPPMEEIRIVLSRFALYPPSPQSLAALDANQLASGLRAIDRYSHYTPPSSPADTLTVPRRLGIDLVSLNNKLWVRPDQNGPADKSGLPEISELLAINNKPLAGSDLASVSAQLDVASQKEKVKLTISDRPNVSSKTYVVKPALLQPDSFTWRQENDSLIIRIREFIAHDTAPGVVALLKTLAHANSRIVIDLRGCSGGDLFEPIELAGMLVLSGRPLISIYGRSGLVKVYQAPPGEKLVGNYWLLMDHNTASAAEILAGILQYYKIAILVGEPSVGKCVSQTIIPLSDGGKLTLTTHTAFFPDNTSCNNIGLRPDVIYPDIGVSKIKDISKKIFKRNSFR